MVLYREGRWRITIGKNTYYRILLFFIPRDTMRFYLLVGEWTNIRHPHFFDRGVSRASSKDYVTNYIAILNALPTLWLVHSSSLLLFSVLWMAKPLTSTDEKLWKTNRDSVPLSFLRLRSSTYCHYEFSLLYTESSRTGIRIYCMSKLSTYVHLVSSFVLRCLSD